MYRCKECNGTNVDHAHWVNLNTEEVGEVFGSWCYGDNQYCNDCCEHTEIEWVDEPADDHPFGVVKQEDDHDRAG